MEYAIIIISLVLVFVALVAVICMAVYVKRLLDNVEEMIGEALSGNFIQKKYDERRLSRLGNRLEHFIASRVISEKKLEEERKEIQQTISDISHQTRTPLTNIIMYSQLISESAGDEGIIKLAGQISGQACRLSFLVQSFIKISHLETGIVKVNPVPQPVTPLFNYLQDTYQIRAASKGIQMSVMDSGEEALYDLKWTKEAVGNIVDNAIKYTPSGGTIDIFVKSYEIFLAIIVKDSGIGIGEEEHAAVFKRFYRSPGVEQDSGTGIGLYLSRKIVSMEDGYIKLESEPGKGSTFYIYFKRPFLA